MRTALLSCPCRRILLAAALAALVSAPARAQSVGVQPAGTEALGRGGAFAARADTPLALFYNVAGLAQRRGTAVLADLHLGAFGLAPCSVPGRAPEPCYGPTVAVSSDLGVLQSWVLGVGLSTEAALMRYPLLDIPGVGFVPRTFLLTPRIGAATRVTRGLHLGLSIEDTIAVADCGGRADCSTSGTSAMNLMVQLGALLELRERFVLGLSLRTANNLGVRRGEDSGPNLPWILRLGGRFSHRPGGRELLDVELDGEYHGHMPREFTVRHVFAVRAGGGLYLPAGPLRLALRLGGYAQVSRPEDYALPPPSPGDQPLRFRVADHRFGATLGGGLGGRVATVNVAYGFEYVVPQGLGQAPPMIHTVSLGMLLRFGG